MNNFSGDSYFVSGNGFSLTSGLTGHNFYELELKKRFAEKCKRRIALVDSSKLNADSTSSFIPADRIDVLITDSGISDEQAQEIRDFGIELVIAPLG